MSNERLEQRLDAMLAPLRDHAAQLDEIAQARVRARLAAALEEAEDVAELEAMQRGRRRRIVVASGFAAAAVFAVIVAMSRGQSRPGELARAADPAPIGSAAATAAIGSAAATAAIGSAAATAATGSAAATAEDPAVADAAVGTTGAPIARAADGAGPDAATASRAAPGTDHAPAIAVGPDPTARDVTGPVTVAAGASVQLTVDGAAVTVYGPGRLSPAAGGAVVEAAGIVVDRTHGTRPWSVRFHGVEIVATRATFAVDHHFETHVTVMRGQIVLSCPTGPRTIRAGGSGTCRLDEVPRVARSPRPPDRVIGEPPAAEAQLPPATHAADPYAQAESALRRGDLAAARDALLAIISANPDSLDAATALLDLARMAAAGGDPTGALGYLDRLDRHPHRAALAQAAAHLRGTLQRSAVVEPRPTP